MNENELVREFMFQKFQKFGEVTDIFIKVSEKILSFITFKDDF